MLVTKPRYALPSFWQSPPPLLPIPPSYLGPRLLPRSPSSFNRIPHPTVCFEVSSCHLRIHLCYKHRLCAPIAGTCREPDLTPVDPHREITPEQTPIWSRLADSAHLPLGSARQRTICGRTPVPAASCAWLSGRLNWHSSRHGFISATISK